MRQHANECDCDDCQEYDDELREEERKRDWWRARAESLESDNQRLRDALKDMLSGWKYIRETHGDLYGVGWDRAQLKAEQALEGGIDGF